MTNDKDSSRSGLPALPVKKGGALLAAIRAGKAGVVASAPSRPDRAALLAAAVTGGARRPRLVFAIDATASRQAAWSAAKATTDSLFQALPGRLDVALAVHGGSCLHTFTDFVADPSALRDKAASIRCEGGQTKLVDILERTRDSADVKVVVYIGDVFEEDAVQAYAAAEALRLRGCRIVILHDSDSQSGGASSSQVFAELARRTGGAVLPFDAGAVNRLRDLLEAIGVLAVGGVKLLEQRRESLPGAPLLLGYLNGDR